MKKILNLLIVLTYTGLMMSSCKKAGTESVLSLPQGDVTALTASTTQLVLTPDNSADTVMRLSWPAVQYGFESIVTYTLQFSLPTDSFNKASNIAVGINELNYGLTGQELNQIALLRGMTAGQAGTLLVRVKSDLKMANSASSTVPSGYSNTLELTITPYSTKPTPKYPVPDSLYIIGGATTGGWNNPVPVPAQRFTKIDETTFGIITQLTGGQEYVFIPVNGSWDHKYNVTDNSNPDLKSGGEFKPDAGDKNIPGPDATGYYKIIVDFVAGTYTVTPFDMTAIPDNLYIVGDATAGAWTNPVPVPSQQFTKNGLYTFDITIPLTTGKEYLFLPVNGSWDHKYGIADKTKPIYKSGGVFTVDSGDNIPAPDESGNYKIEVSFLNNTYIVTKQ